MVQRSEEMGQMAYHFMKKKYHFVKSGRKVAKNTQKQSKIIQQRKWNTYNAWAGTRPAPTTSREPCNGYHKEQLSLT